MLFFLTIQLSVGCRHSGLAMAPAQSVKTSAFLVTKASSKKACDKDAVPLDRHRERGKLDPNRRYVQEYGP